MIRKFTLTPFILAFCIFCYNGKAMILQKDTFSTPSLDGIPEVSHFQKEDFNADSQFWTGCEGKDGVLYFGNNDGAVIYDGERWFKVILPNNSSVRSLIADEEGNIYAGGFNEFGLIKKNTFGNYYYESLVSALNINNGNLANIWQAHSLQGVIIFRSFSTLLMVSDNSKVVQLPTSGAYVRSYVIDNQYYVQDHTRNIYRLDLKNLQLHKFFNAETYHHEEIINLMPTTTSDELVGVSKSGKVYLFHKDSKQTKLKMDLFPDKDKDQVECVIRTHKGDYYIGTLSNKIKIIDKKISTQEKAFQKLQDKTVLHLFQASKGNVWALLNNGLDCINLNSPVTCLLDNVSVYDVLFNNNDMYVAHNQGVFKSSSFNDAPFLSTDSFVKIKELEGQAWRLQIIEDDILVSHDKGLYHLKGNDSYKIGDFGGIWKVLPIKGKPGFYFANGYDGLYVFSKVNGIWTFNNKIEGFVESTRDMMETENPYTYWVCHGYKGVFRINLNEDFTRVTAIEHYTTQNGFKDPFGINVFKWENQTVFTTNHGVYTFDENVREFIPYKPLNGIFDTTKIIRTLLQNHDKTWFVQDEEAGYFKTKDKSPVPIRNYFLKFKGSFNRSMECIIPLENQRVLFGTKSGLFIYNMNNEDYDITVPTRINHISHTLKNSDKSTLLPLTDKPVKLASNTNKITFEYSSPLMQKDVAVEYSYMLENLDSEWSPWSQLSFKEYNFLPPGKYKFKIKSRNLNGMKGSEDAFQFEVLPLWHQTIWAYILFIILGVTVICLLVVFISNKINKDTIKARKEEEKARHLLELELKQMKLQAEKDRITQEKTQLQNDIIFKSKELANYTILLSRKSEVLMELLDDLKILKNYAKNEHSRNGIRDAVRKISNHMADEEYLKVFEVNFEKVHQNFFAQLKELHPDLNQRELRLCAFVKMNLTNKEISPLLNISVRGVETARYRLRKKFNLEHEDNLVEYLESLKNYHKNIEVEV